AIGVTNQRETALVWDRATGQALAPAIVWQCRRTAQACAVLRDEGWTEHVRARTGLVIDPYFSATKWAWFLEHVPGLRAPAACGQACFNAGAAKNTYGTGAFLLLNTGAAAVTSRHDLLTTIAWRIGGAVTYALEGSVFVAGAAVQWLRDGLGLIATAGEVEA